MPNTAVGLPFTSMARRCNCRTVTGPVCARAHSGWNAAAAAPEINNWRRDGGGMIPPRSTLGDVQDRLAGEFPIDEPAGDRADLAPWGFDRDLRPQLFCRDQIGEQREADAGALDTHQLVEQG